MNKLKNYKQLLALLLIGLLIHSCSEDVNDTLTSESDQNFVSKKLVKDVSNNFLFKNEQNNSLNKSVSDNLLNSSAVIWLLL